MLPHVDRPEAVHLVGDTEVKIRCLSWSDAFALKEGGKGYPLIIAAGTGVPVEEAQEWCDNTPPPDVEGLVAAILNVSMLGPGAAKSDPSGATS